MLWLIVLYSCWLGLTVLHQFELPFLRKINFHGFVPSCKFFAPIPMTTDSRVYYACSDSPDAPLSDLDWTAVFGRAKGLLSPLWNPDHRIDKSIHNIARQIVHLRDKTPLIEYTTPYLRLLNLAQAKALKADGKGYVRFIITRHRGMEDPGRWVAFSSLTHRLDDGH